MSTEPGDLTPATPPTGTVADRRNEGPAKAPCRHCSHPKDAHEHHRRGTDCSQSGCDCPKWGRVFPGLHHHAGTAEHG